MGVGRFRHWNLGYFTLLILVIATIVACSSEPVSHIAGGRHTIECHGLVNQCYYRAQDRCANRGYDVKTVNSVMDTVKNAPQERQKKWTVYIVCK